MQDALRNGHPLQQHPPQRELLLWQVVHPVEDEKKQQTGWRPFPPRAAGQDSTGHQGLATVTLQQQGGLAVAELWEQRFH